MYIAPGRTYIHIYIYIYSLVNEISLLCFGNICGLPEQLTTKVQSIVTTHVSSVCAKQFSSRCIAVHNEYVASPEKKTNRTKNLCSKKTLGFLRSKERRASADTENTRWSACFRPLVWETQQKHRPPPQRTLSRVPLSVLVYTVESRIKKYQDFGGHPNYIQIQTPRNMRRTTSIGNI